MGWSIHDVYRATLPELYHSFRGWLKTHGVDDEPEPIEQADLQEMENKVKLIHKERGHTLAFGKQE